MYKIIEIENMYCSKCGNEIQENDLFCSKCGINSNLKVETTTLDENRNEALTSVKNICKKCNSEKNNILEKRVHTGKSICINCDYKLGFCPVCNNKLSPTDTIHNYCASCKSSWNNNVLLSTTTKKTDNDENSINKIRCPKCASTNIVGGKKGFSGTQAVGGALLTGGIGILAGTIGSNKVELSCLSCGNKFKPGEDLRGLRKKRKQEEEAMKSPFFWILLVIIFGIILFVFNGC